MMNKKAAIELSLNFIVFISIAVVILILGIFIFTQILGEGKEITGKIGEDVQDRLNTLLITGRENVIIPGTFRTAGRGDVAAFALGIKNKDCTSGKFTVKTSFDIAVDAKNDLMTNVNSAEIATWYFDQSEYDIAQNDRKIVPVLIRPDKGAVNGWTFSFNVDVLCGTTQYSPLHKIYVVID
ncbi:hypothetical protein KY340_01885 [Candidatus Woesearchaeota archaeon]|nr:hypothetical protein [Candidatus Woesearchaeota archaeon]